MDSRAIISNLEKLPTGGKESALLGFRLANETLKLREIWVAVLHLKRALDLDRHNSAGWKLLGTALTDGGTVRTKPLILVGAASMWHGAAAISGR